MKLKLEKIIEGFAFLPSINLTWLTYCNKKIYDISFTWLKWRLMTTNYKVVLDDFCKDEDDDLY